MIPCSGERGELVTGDDPNELAKKALPVAYSIARALTTNQTQHRETAREAAEEAVIWCLNQEPRDMIALVRSTVPKFVQQAIVKATERQPDPSEEAEPYGEDADMPSAPMPFDQDFLLDIQDMPDELRRAAELVCIEWRSMREAGEILGINHETVKARLEEVYRRMS